MYQLTEKNLSIAWARAFLHLLGSTGGEDSPVIVSIMNEDDGQSFPQEEPRIRAALDAELNSLGLKSIEVVADTIFWQGGWEHSGGDRQKLYERYIRRAWPAIKSTPANRKGTYFKRLIDYGRSDETRTNQLEHIIRTWNGGNHRRSALIATIYDPHIDHSNARQQGFPCLQQVTVRPVGNGINGGIHLTAFYTTQHFFEKAYGNFLGLSRLANFLSNEMNLGRVDGITCIATIGSKGGPSKNALQPLSRKLNSLLPADIPVA